MSQLTELKVENLSEEEIRRLVNDILENPEKYKTEAKFILKLDISFRKGGCGYVYLYDNDYIILRGVIDEVILYRSEFNCDVSEEVVVIPKTVPVIIMQRHHDDNPEVVDWVTVYVFTGKEWKSITFEVPK